MKAGSWSRLAAACLWLATAGCSARRSEPISKAELLTDKPSERGRVVFMEHCNRCHPGGEAGLGPALNHKPLPNFVKRYMVRRGIGSMPAFPQQLINDSDLKDLMSYLTALKRHERGADQTALEEINSRR
ncbi:MAG: cytochrome c [Elusimicrobia bacterium]|nr:cytochrome c [Elusimicrobiota bacterium]